jgi:hypothetical protein
MLIMSAFDDTAGAVWCPYKNAGALHHTYPIYARDTIIVALLHPWAVYVFCDVCLLSSVMYVFCELLLPSATAVAVDHATGSSLMSFVMSFVSFFPPWRRCWARHLKGEAGPPSLPACAGLPCALPRCGMRTRNMIHDGPADSADWILSSTIMLWGAR